MKFGAFMNEDIQRFTNRVNSLKTNEVMTNNEVFFLEKEISTLTKTQQNERNSNSNDP